MTRKAKVSLGLVGFLFTIAEAFAMDPSSQSGSLPLASRFSGVFVGHYVDEVLHSEMNQNQNSPYPEKNDQGNGTESGAASQPVLEAVTSSLRPVSSNGGPLIEPLSDEEGEERKEGVPLPGHSSEIKQGTTPEITPETTPEITPEITKIRGKNDHVLRLPTKTVSHPRAQDSELADVILHQHQPAYQKCWMGGLMKDEFYLDGGEVYIHEDEEQLRQLFDWISNRKGVESFTNPKEMAGVAQRLGIQTLPSLLLSSVSLAVLPPPEVKSGAYSEVKYKLWRAVSFDHPPGMPNDRKTLIIDGVPFYLVQGKDLKYAVAKEIRRRDIFLVDACVRAGTDIFLQFIGRSPVCDEWFPLLSERIMCVSCVQPFIFLLTQVVSSNSLNRELVQEAQRILEVISPSKSLASTQSK